MLLIERVDGHRRELARFSFTLVSLGAGGLLARAAQTVERQQQEPRCGQRHGHRSPSETPLLADVLAVDLVHRPPVDGRCERQCRGTKARIAQ